MTRQGASAAMQQLLMGGGAQDAEPQQLAG